MKTETKYCTNIMEPCGAKLIIKEFVLLNPFNIQQTSATFRFIIDHLLRQNQ